MTDLYEDYGETPYGFVKTVSVQRKPRLTIYVHTTIFKSVASVRLDDIPVAAFGAKTEPEARAAAQAYVDELVKHFREGGE